MRKRKPVRSPIKNQDKLSYLHESVEDVSEIINPLIEKRKKKEWTQTDLAKKIGVHQSAIARFELGMSNPTLLFLLKISQALDLQILIKDIT